MSLRRILALVLLCCLCAPIASATPGPGVTCRSCLVIDDSGAVLFERAAGERRANASTTKMITALVALEHLRPDDEVEVPAEVTTVPSIVELSPGDAYSVRDLLAGMMLESWNDAALTLAHAVSGSERDFVEEMTAFASDLGLGDTAFANAHGLDAPGHHSSAADLARVAEALLGEPLLARLARSRSTTVRGPGGPTRLQTRNLLLGSYEGAIGVKTGQTLQAGNVLVAAARREGRTIIVVVMDSADSFADARALLDLGFATLPRVVLARRGSSVGALVFDGAGAIPIGLGRNVRAAEDPGAVRLDFSPDDHLALPIDEGRSVGMISVEVGGRVVGRAPAVALADLAAPEPSWGTWFFTGLLGLFEPLAELA